MPMVLRGKAVGKVKLEIGFQAHPQWPVCGNCKHFAFERVTHKYDTGSYSENRALRCSKFQIVVGKTSTCKNHKAGQPTITEYEDNREA